MFNPDHEERLGVLLEKIHKAHSVTPDLMARIITQACVRLPALQVASNARRIRRLVESGAYADAALALIELELPRWRLRRLVHEDGAWHCSLSQHPELPISLDETVEANHESLPLAILTAFVEARGRNFTEPCLPSVPQVPSAQEFAVCCENFR
jgi:hypothetical protein